MKSFDDVAYDVSPLDNPADVRKINIERLKRYEDEQLNLMIIRMPFLEDNEKDRRHSVNISIEGS